MRTIDRSTAFKRDYKRVKATPRYSFSKFLCNLHHCASRNLFSLIKLFKRMIPLPQNRLNFPLTFLPSQPKVDGFTLGPLRADFFQLQAEKKSARNGPFCSIFIGNCRAFNC